MYSEEEEMQQYSEDESINYREGQYIMSYNNMLLNSDNVKELFMKYNWIMKENTEHSLIYVNPNNKCDEFILRKASDGKIEVTVPLWNSPIAMTKCFNDYYYAYEFACDKLLYFVNKK
jgi:hypothetical protein